MTQTIKVTDDLEEFLEILPPRVKEATQKSKDLKEMMEVVLDLGKPAEIRFPEEVLYVKGKNIDLEDLRHVTAKLGEFSGDNRAGIERTLHRISAIRNRHGAIIGLTLRVGRAIFGTLDIIRDIIISGKNILFLGPPGIGKTTKLREAARVLSDESGKRVIVVDTSNEIAGDGDIPHPGIGKSRRMQVSNPDRQHAVMIEAVENHMPEVIIVDEIGTEAEAAAARTIAERGVQLIGTAHGNNLDNLLNNPTLSDLVGGIQSVILGDEEARRRRTQKSILERKAPPTFDILIEIRQKDTFAIYPDIAFAVDKILRGYLPQPEMRFRKPSGEIEKIIPRPEMPEVEEEAAEAAKNEKESSLVRIYSFGINRSRIERSLRALMLPARLVNTLDEADLVIMTKPKAKPNSKILKSCEEKGIPVHVIRNNTSSHINRFLKYFFKASVSTSEEEDVVLHEAEEGVEEVLKSKKTVELAPKSSYLRRLQHQLIQKYNLHSESVGEEPKRRVRIYPA